jgi:Cysteine-rich secretory protein family
VLKKISSPLAALLLLIPFAHAQQGATVAEQYLFHAVNQHRAEHGLQPLTWDPALARAARGHAQIIMRNPPPAEHQYPGEPDMKTRAVQAGAHFSVVSENVAGNGTTPIELDEAWMASPVHRANILDPKLTAIGIGVVQRDGLLFGVEDFSRASIPLEPNQVEQKADQILREQGIPRSTDPDARVAARHACQNPNSVASGPVLAMQWDGPDLNQLPDAILKQMPDVRRHTVAIASCPSERVQEGFTTYHVSILIY